MLERLFLKECYVSEINNRTSVLPSFTASNVNLVKKGFLVSFVGSSSIYPFIQKICKLNVRKMTARHRRRTFLRRPFCVSFVSFLYFVLLLHFAANFFFDVNMASRRVVLLFCCCAAALMDLSEAKFLLVKIAEDHGNDAQMFPKPRISGLSDRKVRTDFSLILNILFKMSREEKQMYII